MRLSRCTSVEFCRLALKSNKVCRIFYYYLNRARLKLALQARKLTRTIFRLVT